MTRSNKETHTISASWNGRETLNHLVFITVRLAHKWREHPDLRNPSRSPQGHYLIDGRGRSLTVDGWMGRYETDLRFLTRTKILGNHPPSRKLFPHKGQSGTRSFLGRVWNP